MAEETPIRVRLVTPDKVFLDGTATAVTLPGRSGVMQAFYGHAPLLTELDAGDVVLTGGDIGEREFFVIWGFAEVLPNRVTILAEKVIHRSEIDVAEARRQLDLGKKMWGEAGEDAVRYAEANQTMQLAEQLIAAAEHPEKPA